MCNSYAGISGFLKLWDLKVLFLLPEKGMGAGECQLGSSQPSILPPTFGQQPEQSKDQGTNTLNILMQLKHFFN